MAEPPPLASGSITADADAFCERRRLSDASRHRRETSPLAPRRAVRPVLLLVALVNLAWSLYQLPVSRVLESRLCHDHYAAHDPSALRPDGSVPEELCKVDAVQQRLGRIQGVMEAAWVAGDFVMTIPLISLADHYGHRFVLCLNLVPRALLLGWTFAVGYFDQALPVSAILVAPLFSVLGGDCVFNSIVYALVSDLTDDPVLRATFFGYVSAVSSIFSLQLGPALASATMSSLLWLPLWIGIALLLLAVPVISSLPSATAPGKLVHQIERGESASPLLSPAVGTSRRGDLRSATAARFRSVFALLWAPSRNFVLLLTVFFLASLASSDTKLLPLYISTRYGWRFASVGYLLSVKGLVNFILLSLLIPRYLRWRRSRRHRQSSHTVPSNPTTPVTGLSSSERGMRRRNSSSNIDDDDNNNSCSNIDDDDNNKKHSDAVTATETDRDNAKENISLAHTSLIFSVLGALAIALSPAILLLVPSLLLYTLGIALPMFTYSLLKAPGMGLPSTEGQVHQQQVSQQRDEEEAVEEGEGEDAEQGDRSWQGRQLVSVVMLVRTVGSLVGAVLMPSLWVAGLGVGSAALGMPYAVSAACYGLAGVLVRRIKV